MVQSFLSCDWGTSHFRLRLIDISTLEIQAEIHTEEGVSHIAQSSTPSTREGMFIDVLSRHIKTLSAHAQKPITTCVISGMASSTLGWVELPYTPSPVTLTSASLLKKTFNVSIDTGNIAVTLISGLRCADDVIRGEECELLGLLDLVPELLSSNTRVLLPGTHSKHIHLNFREVSHFTTFMTGELFMHLRDLPTLKASLSDEDTFVESDFCEGVRSAQKFDLSAGLFKIRSRTIIDSLQPQDALSFLSGLLIGKELLNVPTDAKAYLAGSPKLHPLYLMASAQLGLKIEAISPDILRNALIHAHKTLYSDS